MNFDKHRIQLHKHKEANFAYRFDPNFKDIYSYMMIEECRLNFSEIKNVFHS